MSASSKVGPTVDGGGATSAVAAGEEPAREMLWPPNGYVFEQEFMLPAYCKPKLIPLKSVTLEKLEKMQAENVERLRKLEREQEMSADQQSRADSGGGAQASSKPDIWTSD